MGENIRRNYTIDQEVVTLFEAKIPHGKRSTWVENAMRQFNNSSDNKLDFIDMNKKLVNQLDEKNKEVKMLRLKLRKLEKNKSKKHVNSQETLVALKDGTFVKESEYYGNENEYEQGVTRND